MGTAEKAWTSATSRRSGPQVQDVREVFRFVVRNTTLDEASSARPSTRSWPGKLSTLDPHTEPAAPRGLREHAGQHRRSSGLQTRHADGNITVIRVIEDNPASKVDMRPGDRTQIDAESTVTMNLNEGGRLAARPRRHLRHRLRHARRPEAQALEITRATIQLDSADGDVLDIDAGGKTRKVGLVQIPRNFSQRCSGQELRDKLAEFERQGVEGVVLICAATRAACSTPRSRSPTRFSCRAPSWLPVGVAFAPRRATPTTAIDFPGDKDKADCVAADVSVASFLHEFAKNR